MRLFCLTLVRETGAEPVELAHVHAETDTQEEATAVLLKACIDHNIDITGCTIVVMETLVIPDGVVRFHTEARRLNHGSSVPTQPPSMYCDPGSGHFH